MTNNYPRRSPFFFAKALRRMSGYAVSQDVGPLGYAILVEVALTEDKRGYKSPPRFTQCSLADRLGVNRKTISAAIDRCVEFGWLHWEQIRQNGQGKAWITFPDWAVDDDEPLSEKRKIEPPVSDDVRSSKKRTNEVAQNNSSSKKRTNDRTDDRTDDRTNDRTDDRTNDRTNDTTHIFPIPNPNPHPPPQERSKNGRAGGQMEIFENQESDSPPPEQQLADELRLLGLRKPVEAARSGLSKLSLQQIRPHLDHFRSHPGAWGAVILFWRLNSPSLALWKPEEGWPDPLPGFAAAASRQAVDARTEREAAERRKLAERERKARIEREKERQLLIDWEKNYGHMIDSMSEQEIDVIIARCPPCVGDHFRRRGRDRKFDLVRTELLRALATNS